MKDNIQQENKQNPVMSVACDANFKERMLPNDYR